MHKQEKATEKLKNNENSFLLETEQRKTSVQTNFSMKKTKNSKFLKLKEKFFYLYFYFSKTCKKKRSKK